MTRPSPRAEWKSISVQSAAIRVQSLRISLSTTAPTPERNRSRVPSARTRPATNPTSPNISGYTRGRSGSRVPTAPSSPTGKTDYRHTNVLTCKLIKLLDLDQQLLSCCGLLHGYFFYFFLLCYGVCNNTHIIIHPSYYITHTYTCTHSPFPSDIHKHTHTQ